MKWDYHVTELRGQPDASQIQEKLKELGEKEWELDFIDHESDRTLLIFKQELKEPKREVKVILHDFEPKKDDEEPITVEK